MLNLIGTIIVWLVLAFIAFVVASIFIVFVVALVKERIPRAPHRTVLTRADVELILEETIAALRSGDEGGNTWDGWDEFMAIDFDDADLALAQLRCRDFEIPPTDEFEDEPARLSEALEEVLAKLRRATPHRIGFE